MTSTVIRIEGPTDVPMRVALCFMCYVQAKRDGLELVDAASLDPREAIISGHCHGCGGGWCECRGRLPCAPCPRKNSPVILIGLKLYRVVVPPPPETMPAALGGCSDD